MNDQGSDKTPFSQEGTAFGKWIVKQVATYHKSNVEPELKQLERQKWLLQNYFVESLCVCQFCNLLVLNLAVQCNDCKEGWCNLDGCLQEMGAFWKCPQCEKDYCVSCRPLADQFICVVCRGCVCKKCWRKCYICRSVICYNCCDEDSANYVCPGECAQREREEMK